MAKPLIVGVVISLNTSTAGGFAITELELVMSSSVIRG